MKVRNKKHRSPIDDAERRRRTADAQQRFREKQRKIRALSKQLDGLVLEAEEMPRGHRRSRLMQEADETFRELKKLSP